jgi:uncharacterized protein YigA (DUF484 family)
LPRPARAAGATAAEVAAFLRAHPGFLTAHPDLYQVLTPPQRVHGETLTDHMAAMLAAARHDAAGMAARADSVLQAGRATAGMAARVQQAVLALFGAPVVGDCVAAAFPALLAVDAASLCAEGDLPGARPLPAGMVASLLGSRAVVLRPGGVEAPLLHGEAARLARHEALVLVPGEGTPVLLALVSRDALALDPAQGTGALGFLGRAVAAALGR